MFCVACSTAKLCIQLSLSVAIASFTQKFGLALSCHYSEVTLQTECGNRSPFVISSQSTCPYIGCPDAKNLLMLLNSCATMSVCCSWKLYTCCVYAVVAGCSQGVQGIKSKRTEFWPYIHFQISRGAPDVSHQAMGSSIQVCWQANRRLRLTRQ